MKKHLFFTLTLALALTLSFNAPVFAEEAGNNTVDTGETADQNEGIMLHDNSPSDGSASSAGAGEVGTGMNSEDLDQNSAAVECLEEDCPDASTIEHEGLSGEPEVVCADENEPDCESAGESEDGEPELWPVYVALGALGAMIILVIIINIIGSRKRKK